MVLPGLLLAGCGQETIKPGGAEQSVVQVVSERTGFHPKDVKCPSGIAAKPGTTFECHFTGPDGPYTAHMRIDTVHGTRVLFDVRTVPTGR